jgi:uncharacterized protein
VKDPREVVKPGDVVKVKVLDVDVARSRISLTLRLDDEVGQGPAAGGGRARSGQSGGQGGGRPGRQRSGGGRAAAPDTALADALRRAGLTGPADRPRR